MRIKKRIELKQVKGKKEKMKIYESVNIRNKIKRKIISRKYIFLDHEKFF